MMSIQIQELYWHVHEISCTIKFLVWMYSWMLQQILEKIIIIIINKITATKKKATLKSSHGGI